MKINYLSALLLTASFSVFSSQVALADTKITAHLLDTGPAMKIEADTAAAPAGDITFHAINDSKYKVHEMIVVKVNNFSDAIPYNKEKNRADEEKMQAIGEVEGLKPGESKEVKLNLKAGKYYLMCNRPDHLESGMFTSLIVY